MARKRKGKGHELELLIEKIERAIAATPLEIKINDLVRDKYGDIREVDISIRGKVGTVDIFVIIECRNRNSIQDKRWVEEVASKRESLNASKAILVSTSGFYKSAYKIANDKAIVLRTVDDATYEDVKEWLHISTIEVNMYTWQHLGYEPKIVLKEPQLINQSIINSLINQLQKAMQDPNEPIFLTPFGAAISPSIIWNDVVKKQEQYFNRCKARVDRTDKALKIRYKVSIVDTELFFRDNPTFFVSELIFLMQLSKEVKHIDASISKYNEEAGNIAQVVNFSTELDGVKIDADFIKHADGKTTVLIESDKPIKGTLNIQLEAINDKGDIEIIEYHSDSDTINRHRKPKA